MTSDREQALADVLAFNEAMETATIYAFAEDGIEVEDFLFYQVEPDPRFSQVVGRLSSKDGSKFNFMITETAEGDALEYDEVDPQMEQAIAAKIQDQAKEPTEVLVYIADVEQNCLYGWCKAGEQIKRFKLSKHEAAIL